MDDSYEIDLREIIKILKNNLLAIICCTVSGACIAIALTIFLIPEKFQSDATLIVNTRDTQATTITYDQINSAKQLIDTYAVILKSDTVLDTVIANLKLNEIDGFEGITAKSLANGVVTISQVESTQVMKISAVTQSADLSTDIVSEIVKLAPDMIISTVKAGSVEIISSPKAQPNKVSPSLSKNAAIGLMAGFILSAGIALLVGILDRSIKSDDDITEHLGLAVLGVIPDIGE